MSGQPVDVGVMHAKYSVGVADGISHNELPELLETDPLVLDELEVMTIPPPIPFPPVLLEPPAPPEPAPPSSTTTFAPHPVTFPAKAKEMPSAAATRAASSLRNRNE